MENEDEAKEGKRKMENVNTRFFRRTPRTGNGDSRLLKNVRRKGAQERGGCHWWRWWKESINKMVVIYCCQDSLEGGKSFWADRRSVRRAWRPVYLARAEWRFLFSLSRQLFAMRTCVRACVPGGRGATRSVPLSSRRRALGEQRHASGLEIGSGTYNDRHARGSPLLYQYHRPRNPIVNSSVPFDYHTRNTVDRRCCDVLL